MKNRISSYGYDYWQPLNLNRPLASVARLRRELLELHADGLRQIRAYGPVPHGAPARAVAHYQRMLVTIRDVTRTAERGDSAAFQEADVRMRLAIQATRTAFARAGAQRICDFAI